MEPKTSDANEAAGVRLVPSSMSGGQIAVLLIAIVLFSAGIASPLVGQFGVLGNVIVSVLLIAGGGALGWLLFTIRRQWVELSWDNGTLRVMQGAGQRPPVVTTFPPGAVRIVDVELDDSTALRSYGHHISIASAERALALAEGFNIPKENLYEVRARILAQLPSPAADRVGDEPGRDILPTPM